MSDPFDTIREALGIPAEHHRRCDTHDGGDCDCYMRRYASALAALDEIREQLRQAEQAAGAEAQLADESQRWAKEQQARADRAEQENRRLREALTHYAAHLGPQGRVARGALAAAEDAE